LQRQVNRDHLEIQRMNRQGAKIDGFVDLFLGVLASWRFAFPP